MKNVYVGNLDFGASEQDIRTLFEQYGQVDNVSLVRDKFSGQSRGFAFVEMSNDSEADTAIQNLNGHPLGKRNLTVNEARPKVERSGGGHDRGARPAYGRRY